MDNDLRLKISYWYVSNKLQIKKGFTYFLIFLSVVFYGYALYGLVMIFFVEQPAYRQSMMELSSNYIDYSYWRERNRPADLQFISFTSIGGREGRYDFVALIKNPNPNQVAKRVVFQLISGGNVIAEKETFIYPNEEKYVAFFGQELQRTGDEAIKIAETDWQRIFGFESLKESRIKFQTENIEFLPASESGIRGDLPVSTLNFQITNQSAYSYWQVGIYMILISGGREVGANFIYLDQFKSGQTREIKMRFYESLPGVSDVIVQPEVDILSPDAYMPVF